jgi:hypothetical protein
LVASMVLRYGRKWILPLFGYVIVIVLFGPFTSEALGAAVPMVRVGYPQPSGAMLPSGWSAKPSSIKNTACRCRIFLFPAPRG